MADATAAGGLEIRVMRDADYPRIAEIYASGIAGGDASFVTQPPPLEKWTAEHLPAPRLVALLDGVVVAWAALGTVSSGPAYGGVTEDSVYVDPSVFRRGVGRALLNALVEAAEAAGIWTIEAWIFPENRASIALHESCGFRVVGRREKLGKMGNRWRDVILLERRSPNI